MNDTFIFMSDSVLHALTFPRFLLFKASAAPHPHTMHDPPPATHLFKRFYYVRAQSADPCLVLCMIRHPLPHTMHGPPPPRPRTMHDPPPATHLRRPLPRTMHDAPPGTPVLFTIPRPLPRTVHEPPTPASYYA